MDHCYKKTNLNPCRFDLFTHIEVHQAEKPDDVRVTFTVDRALFEQFTQAVQSLDNTPHGIPCE